ncbi:MAG: hypothetical protein JXA03_15745 [Bacteroidales bacterium]|nr:hypothetical protein [Bacteroidales bacterium]
MNLKEIKSYNEFTEKTKGKRKAYLLLYKRGSEQSDCSLRNLEAVPEKEAVEDIFVADVNVVKDIHEKYSVSTVPTILEFEEGRFINTLKGCHQPGFYKSFFENAVYAASAGSENAQKSVTVYTTPTCSWCNTIKTHFRKHGIRYREVDVSRNQSAAEEMQRKSGQMGVPQTDIGGEIVVGFDKQRINTLLGING